MTDAKQITELTPEQEAQLDVYAKKWTDLALSHVPCDRTRAEASIRKVYELAGFKAPDRIIWAKTPFDGIKVASEISGIAERDLFYKAGYGQFDAFWLAYYDYCDEVLGVKAPELEGLKALAQDVGWWWAFDEAVVLTERAAPYVDAQGDLHREDGPAIFGKDEECYYWHGTEVPEFVIMKPEGITPELIRKEENQEVRRAMLERFGLDRFTASMTLVHQDSFGKLYRTELPGAPEPIQVVMVKNSTPEPDGTYKDYGLSCPPSVRTAREAVAWTFGFDNADEYAPVVET